MPYSSVADLPASVRAKLKGKKLRQWMHVWNSSYKEHQSESIAFASAWAAVRKREAQAQAAAAAHAAEQAAIPKRLAAIEAHLGIKPAG